MKRDDALVIEGGLMQVRGQPGVATRLGLPRGISLASMSETMVLALQGQWDNFTGPGISPPSRWARSTRLAAHHNFKLAGLRSFEPELDPARVVQVKA